MSREIKIRFPGRNVHGVDFSARAIQLAKAMNQDYPEISFETRDIIEDKSHYMSEVAVLMEVLEHIPPESLAEFVAGVHRQLIPGGTLLLTVPHANKLLEYKHFRHFDSAGLRDTLEPYFDIVEILPFERRSPLTKMLRLLIGNSLYVLSNAALLDLAYGLYKKHLFHCRNENQCQRLFLLAKAR
jgi:SAM-dependent methyltransferase